MGLAQQHRIRSLSAMMFLRPLWNRLRSSSALRWKLNGSRLGVAARGFGVAQAWIPATVARSSRYCDYLTTNENFIMVGCAAMSRLTRLAPSSRVVGPRIHAEQPSDADSMLQDSRPRLWDT